LKGPINFLEPQCVCLKNRLYRCRDGSGRSRGCRHGMCSPVTLYDIAELAAERCQLLVCSLDCFPILAAECSLESSSFLLDLVLDCLCLRDIYAFCRQFLKQVVPVLVVPGELIHTGGLTVRPPRVLEVLDRR